MHLHSGTRPRPWRVLGPSVLCLLAAALLMFFYSFSQFGSFVQSVDPLDRGDPVDLEVIDGTGVDIELSARDSRVQPTPIWRSDLRCGAAVPIDESNGRLVGCEPRSATPCCSRTGECGASDFHCNCEGCVDYSARRPPKHRWRRDGRCGAGFALSDGRPAECDPDSERPCCSVDGHCGSSRLHCDCEGCVNHAPWHITPVDIALVQAPLEARDVTAQLCWTDGTTERQVNSSVFRGLANVRASMQGTASTEQRVFELDVALLHCHLNTFGGGDLQGATIRRCRAVACLPSGDETAPMCVLHSGVESFGDDCENGEGEDSIECDFYSSVYVKCAAH